MQFLSNVVMMGKGTCRLCRSSDKRSQGQVRTNRIRSSSIYVIEHFEVYILGYRSTVFTDHQALVSAFLSHMKNQTTGILARWYLHISCFLSTLKIEFKPGATNVIADALLRAPVTSESSGSVLLVTKNNGKTRIWLT